MFTIVIKCKRWLKGLLKVQSASRQDKKLTGRAITVRVVYLVIFSILVGVFYPADNLFDPLDMPRTGEIALQDFTAPFTITLFKSDDEIDKEKEDVRLSVPYVIDSDTTVFHTASGNIKRFLNSVDSLRNSADTLSNSQLAEHALFLGKEYPLLSESTLVQSLVYDSLYFLGEIVTGIYFNYIYEIGVLPEGQKLPKTRNISVLIRRGLSENIYGKTRLLHLNDAYLLLLEKLNKTVMTDSIDVNLFYNIGRTFMITNLTINIGEYEARVLKGISAISNIKGIVDQGEIIIRSGSKVSEGQEETLVEMAKILRAQAADEGWLVTILPALAKVVLVLFAFSLLFLFLLYFRRDIFASLPKILAILMVFVVQLLLIYLIDNWSFSSYLYPVAFLSILITILFDAELGVLATVVLALLLGILNRFDFNITLMTISVGIVASFASREVRKRAHFFRIMFATSVTYVLYIFLVENMRITPMTEIFTESSYGIINGVVSSFLVIGFLPFVEALFGITTDITLLELSDMNHPLLKRLALESPGTYHHTIIVGNLSEAATKAIEGNSLLARVGTYYHDIGKIEIPEYFVENQLGIKSKHEMLTPSMSAIILASHVKKGRVLGEMNDLPDDVLNFIEEHHGTMVMIYFYNKALEEGADPSCIDKFRYPGPKPQSKETGVVMLADAVEAASRTLEDPKPARLNNLIQGIIDDRVKSGELDECPLTLRDLAKIKEAFTQILIGTFHKRIAYPKEERKQKVK